MATQPGRALEHPTVRPLHGRGPVRGGPGGGTGGFRPAAKRVAKKASQDRISVAAGNLAYHWFLAIFPAVIALLGLIALTHLGGGALTHLEHGIGRALPAGAAGVFTGAVRSATHRRTGSVVAVVVGIAVALWSASAGMAALEQALDIAYGVGKDRKFLARRLRAIALMVPTLVIGGACAALIVFGAPIGGAVSGHVPLHGTAFSVAWTVVRLALTALLLSGLFSFLYAFGPNREGRPFRWVSPGGAIATATFLLVSLAFSFYVSAFGSYAKTYGSFAGVAILILWLYLIGLAVLLGAEVNAEFEAARSGVPRRLTDRATA